MFAVMLTGLFVAAAVLATTAILATFREFGHQALARRGELAAASPTRGYSFKVTEHRPLRGDVNVVILPVRKASYRLLPAEGLRAAA